MTTPVRAPYDLSTAAFDYPEWRGAPRRTIVIATHPRSGSTLLGEALHAAGDLGCPLEYLHAGFRPGFAARWKAHDLDVYVAALHRHRTSPGGILGIKLFWRDVRETVRERLGLPTVDAGAAEDIEADPATFAVLRDLLPNPTFVHLVRRDRVRAAVSAYVAMTTGVFRALDAPTLAQTRADVPYDYDAILGCLGALDRSDARWRAFFAANGITPVSVDYEQLVARFDDTIGRLLDELGHPRASTVSRTPRLTRQSADVSERLVLRFIQDDARLRPARS